MRGQKHEKKSIKELEVKLAEFIGNSGRTEQDIHTNYKDYRALKKGLILLALILTIMTFGGDVNQFSVRYEYVLFGAPDQGQTLDVYRSDF